MPVSQSFFTPLFLIAAFIAVTAGTLFFIRFQTKLTGWAGVFSLAMALDLTCYYLTLNSATPDAMQFWLRILVVIYLFLSIAWLFFVIMFTGHTRWINPRNIIIVGGFPMLLAGIFLLTLPKVDPVWMNTIGSVTGWIRGAGLPGYLFAFYLFGIDFISAGLLIRMISNNHPYFRNLALFLCVGTLMVIVAGFLELGGSNPFAPVSIVQLFKIIHSIMAFIGVFMFRGGHVLPVARDAAFKHIQDGMLVLDRNDNIVDLNPAAIQIIGQDEETVIGKPIAQVWQRGTGLLAEHSDIGTSGREHTLPVNGVEQTFDVMVSPVLDSNREGIGRVILLRNITRREQMGKALQERTRELTRTNKLVTALSSIAAHLGSAPDMDLGFDILGSELHKLGLNCAVATIDESQEAAVIRYVSFNPVVLRKMEKITGVSLRSHVISKQYWPGERVFTENAPIWYSKPREIISRMFPSFPEAIADQAWKLTGISSEGQICIMPLRVEDRVIGAMPIWGADLRPSDSPVLAIFASQVAGILQNAFAYERELERANELARSNSIILALSKVASQLENSSDSNVIFETVGTELKKMGLDSAITVLDDKKQYLQIRYLPVHQGAVRWIEKMSGYRLSEIPLPRHLWPTTKAIDEKITYWDVMKSTFNVLPNIPEGLQKAAMKMAGINLDDPVCYLPIATEDEVIGVLAVWGAKLNKNDVPALSILANQVAAAIRNSNLFEAEARRARELDILLKASEATSSSLDPDTVLLTLATQLLELSGYESCYISEWDREANLIYGRVEHSRILWAEEKRDAYSLSDYPQTRQVLLTGKPIILQGDFKAEERQWMEQLGRAAVMILPLYAEEEEVIGLVEIAMSGDNKLFTLKSLQKCEEVILNAAPSLLEPLPANDAKDLFVLEEKLLRVSGGDICSFSEWDRPRNRVITYVVASDQISAMGQSRGMNPEKDAAWKLALQEGKTSVWMHSEGNERIEVTGNGTVTVEVEALILFPLEKGDERIGLIELYDFNHKTQVSPEQLALMRAIADKAGFWIENARLLQQTQKRLEEQTELLHEKEVLLKEIHHRVKNNLQIISSLLNLQANRVSDVQAIQTLRDSQSRVRSMSLIHEKLYQSQSLAKIDFGEYVQSLANDLFRSYRQNFSGIQLDVRADKVLLELDQAIPCGLILNELITNALKYAYADGRNGTIKVELRANPENTVTLRVADDGMGMPADFDVFNAKSLGLQLIASLVTQLDGKLELGNSRGTDYLVSFSC
ncbi:MAG: PAS domain S-box protein [Chloroflexi bacterium]|nr:PAS domain S-box protein [Chloroflexota bacterium]